MGRLFPARPPHSPLLGAMIQVEIRRKCVVVWGGEGGRGGICFLAYRITEMHTGVPTTGFRVVVAGCAGGAHLTASATRQQHEYDVPVTSTTTVFYCCFINTALSVSGRGFSLAAAAAGGSTFIYYGKSPTNKPTNRYARLALSATQGYPLPAHRPLSLRLLLSS